MIRLMIRVIGPCAIALVLVCVVGCQERSETENESEQSEMTTAAGGWIAPDQSQFEAAYEWGLSQGDADVLANWQLCVDKGGDPSESTHQEASSSTSPCLESALVYTPLATTAAVAQARAAGLPNAELMGIIHEQYELGSVTTLLILAFQVEADYDELRELLSNKLTVLLYFEGSIWDLDYSHEGQIEQGDYVIAAHDVRVTYSDEARGVFVESRFDVRPLDPDRVLWCTVTQDQGGRRFLFKIDPNALGAEGIF